MQVIELTEQFPAAIPLALVLKKFLADRSLDRAYSGGLSSYCLVLLITRFLQHEHHLGRAINQAAWDQALAFSEDQEGWPLATLHKLQVVIDSVQGASGTFQIDSFYSNFPQLASPSTTTVQQGIGPVSASKLGDPPKASTCEQEGGNHSVAPAVLKSLSSSFSQSSSSSHCFSSRSQHQLVTCSTSFSEDILIGEKENSSESGLKRARSEAEIHVNSSQEATNVVFSRCESHKSVITGHRNVNLPNFVGQADAGVAWRVKVTYGKEKIRFRLGKSWGYKELVQEVVRRFDIGDMGGFHLKYLDDDSEWVLLTCDADLEECIYVCRLSQPQTIKLSLQVSHSNSTRSYVGSNTV